MLSKEIDVQKEKIATLEKALANAASSFGDIGTGDLVEFKDSAKKLSKRENVYKNK